MFEFLRTDFYRSIFCHPVISYVELLKNLVLNTNKLASKESQIDFLLQSVNRLLRNVIGLIKENNIFVVEFFLGCWMHKSVWDYLDPLKMAWANGRASKLVPEGFLK